MKFFKGLCLSLALVSISFAQEFAVDIAHSNVGFSAKHNTVSYILGRFNSYEASVDYNEKQKIFNTIKADIDVSSINTNVEKRDAHLKSADFFDAAKFPKMTFSMTKYIKKTDNEGKVIGNLTMKNITKEVELDAKVHGTMTDKNKKQRIGFTLLGKINRKDFKVGDSFPEVIIGDFINLEINVEAIGK